MGQDAFAKMCPRISITVAVKPKTLALFFDSVLAQQVMQALATTGMVCPSVHLSVRLSRAGIVSKRLKLRSRNLYRPVFGLFKSQYIRNGCAE